MKQTSFLLRYTLQTFAVVLLAAVFLRIFFVSSFVISGWSMLPSIWPGDFIVASRWRPEQVTRGTVVALRCPQSKEQICLRRVVGLPGDRIEFNRGILLINGQAATHSRISPDVEHEAVAGSNWLIWPAAEASQAVSAAVVVPPEQIYVLNDKRSDQNDSRLWGPVSADHIEGRAKLIWLSLDWYEGEDVRAWPRVRWTRILRSIH